MSDPEAISFSKSESNTEEPGMTDEEAETK